VLYKTKKPYVIYLAEVIYINIANIKKNNLDISNISSIPVFIEDEYSYNVASLDGNMLYIIFLFLVCYYSAFDIY
jgi:hypothetical protein